MIKGLNLELFNSINQLICNNSSQNFIIHSNLTRNNNQVGDQDVVKWNLYSIANVKNKGEYFWNSSLNYDEIDSLLTVDRTVTKGNDLLKRMKESWDQGNLRIEGFESKQFKRAIIGMENLPSLKLIFDITTSLKVIIPLSPSPSPSPPSPASPASTSTTSTSSFPSAWILLEEILPASLTSIKNAQDLKLLRTEYSKLDLLKSTESAANLRLKEEIRVLKKAGKVNGYRGKYNVSPIKVEGEGEGGSSSLSSTTTTKVGNGRRAPPAKRKRVGLSLEEFAPGIASDSD